MSTKFQCDYAHRNSGCKKCKQPIAKSSLRLAKVVPNAFSESSDEMKQYFHAECLFDTFTRARATTKIIETVGDLDGYAALEDDDKKIVRELIEKIEESRENEKNGTMGKTATLKVKETKVPTPVKAPTIEAKPTTPTNVTAECDTWFNFIKLCRAIGTSSKYTDKTEHVHRHIRVKSYSGDVYLLVKMLLPSIDQRVYNVKEKQIIKHFAGIFDTDVDEMTDHYNKSGEVSDTIAHFFSKSTTSTKPSTRSTLTMSTVDTWLDKLADGNGDDSTAALLKSITRECTTVDLQWIIRQIMSDLRVNCGVKHVMEGLAENAYAAFQSCRNLRQVVDKAVKQMESPGVSKALSVGITIQQPVLPMLAEACRSVEFAFKRCPKGMLAEIKYDGERVQLHKTSDDQFSFYSRSLKPVQPHKVADVKLPVINAFPKGVSCILDCEVLVVDTNTGKPLPFGTLGKNKKAAISNAQTCLFVFDMLMYDDESLMNKTLLSRKKLLHTHMTPVSNRVLFSDYEHIGKHDDDKLKTMIDSAIDDGLEGLVMKDVNGVYEPGKRHWLKVKKDYLEEGKMADSADLLVLGGYYGTGSKGGIMSVFLMGVRDPITNTYRTVTKCGNGHDDATLTKVNKELNPLMTKISADADRIPKWLRCERGLTPDFVITDPTTAPVWEIVGAEFSKSTRHTADGVSIRFPRVTKIRDDKDYKTATNLQELVKLYNTSKVKTDMTNSPQKASELAGGAVGLAAKLSRNVFNSTTPSTTVKEEPSGPSDTPTPKAPKRRSDALTVDDRPMCKYGVECYQQNPAHKKQYRHKEVTTDVVAPKKIKDDTFFRFHSVHVASEDTVVTEKVSRLVNHYGGMYITDAMKLEPGHYIVGESKSVVEKYLSTKGVTTETKSLVMTHTNWIFECVKNKKLVDGEGFDFEV